MKNRIKEKLMLVVIWMFVLYSTGLVNVLAEFWRTVGNTFTAPSNKEVFTNWYGYGGLGWGYGYWYGYGYKDYEAGYYYKAAANWPEDYENPYEVDLDNIENVARINWPINNASSVTITAPAKLTSDDNKIEVILPSQVVIEDANGNNFDFSQLQVDSENTVNDLSIEWVALEFGLNNRTLKFSRSILQIHLQLQLQHQR